MKDFDPDNLILLGIGNSGREDDGLGWKFLDMVSVRFQHITLQYRYQLQIEDAELITQYATVVFVDSSKKELPLGYSWECVIPKSDLSFTTHFLQPESVLNFCKDLYSKEPDAYILGIQGYRWELGVGCSPKALENLSKAMRFFEDLLS